MTRELLAQLTEQAMVMAGYYDLANAIVNGEAE